MVRRRGSQPASLQKHLLGHGRYYGGRHVEMAQQGDALSPGGNSSQPVDLLCVGHGRYYDQIIMNAIIRNPPLNRKSMLRELFRTYYCVRDLLAAEFNVFCKLESRTKNSQNHVNQKH